MKSFMAENWPDLADSMLQGLRDGLFAAVLVLILIALADLAASTQAALSIVRDLRGEFRSAVGSSGAKESDEG